MNHHYNCIRSRITEEPQWWDENAVPRYEPFTPAECANIYADECVLFEVACQNCERVFKVCLSWSTIDAVRDVPRLSAHVADLHYGDPPNVDCCPAGPTMNSVPVRVLEFWRQAKMEWERAPELEIALGPEWAKDGGAL